MVRHTMSWLNSLLKSRKKTKIHTMNLFKPSLSLMDLFKKLKLSKKETKRNSRKNYSHSFQNLMLISMNYWSKPLMLNSLTEIRWKTNTRFFKNLMTLKLDSIS